MITFLLTNGQFIFTAYFYIQIFFVSVLLLKGQKKRDHFPLRFIIAFLLASILALFVPPRFTDPSEAFSFKTVLFEVLSLCMNFTLFVLIFMIPYDIKWNKSLFILCVSYNIQHFVYSVHSVIGKAWSFSPWDEISQIFFALLLGFTFSFVMRKYLFIAGKNRSLIVILLSTVVVNDFLSVLQMSTNSFSLTKDLYHIEVAIHCAVILYLAIVTTYKLKAESTDNMVKLKIEDTKSDFKDMMFDYEQMRIRNHDLKHFVRNFEDKLSKEDIAAFDALIDRNDIYYSEVNTGLDYILIKKREKCLRKNIEFTFNGDTRLMSFMKESDVFVLFGNMIDNAIEAVSNIKDPERRVVTVSVREEAGFVIIESFNYFDNQIIEFNGDFKTTKDSKSFHGLGINSIKRTVSKYDGLISIRHDNHVFAINLAFNMNK